MAYGIIRYVFHPHRRWIVMIDGERYGFHSDNSKEAILVAVAERGEKCDSIAYECREGEGSPWQQLPDKPEAHNDRSVP